MNKCLYCYKELSQEDRETTAGKAGYHNSCSRKFYGKTPPPELPYTEEDMLKLAEQIIKSQKTVTGVQAKLSMGIERIRGSQIPDRFTIVGVMGEYILKPQTEHYKSLPEIEDITMHLAEISKIRTVPHSLIQLRSGQLAYITKRVDRDKTGKLHMEDMCQLTERLTEQKYNGSYEQIAKAIIKYSNIPRLDVINFYEQVIFSFLTGNNDMHLKNFSLLKDKSLNYGLCPAYDMVASELVVEGDDEELALNLNGKKKKFKQRDFEVSMKNAEMEDKVIKNIFQRFSKLIPKWHEFIDISFLSNELKESYHEMIEKKTKQIEL